MSLFGSLASGVSGLTAQSSAMGAISDNIANVNTTGYKSTTVKFSTLVTTQTSTTRYSTGGVQARPKQGVDIQGLLESTSNATDIGISGNGFFVVNGSSIPTSDDLWCYTRAGSFYKDDDGYLKNTSGYYMMAWTLLPYDGTEGVSTVEINGDYYMKAYVDSKGMTQYINDNIIDSNNLQSVNLANIGGSATATMNVTLGANLPSSDPIYDATNPALGGQYSTAVLVYDSLGNSHNLQFEFTKTTANSWGLDTKMPSGAATLTTYSTTENTQDTDPDIYSARAQLEFSQIPSNHSTISMTIDNHTYVYEFTTDGTTVYSPNANEEVIAVDVLTGILTVSDFVERFAGILQEKMPSGNRFSAEVDGISIEQSYGGEAILFDTSKCSSCLQSAANPDPTTGIPTGIFTLEEIDWDIKNIARINFEGKTANDYIGKSLTLGTHSYVFTTSEATVPYGINVNISTAINDDGTINRTRLINLLKAEINKSEPEPERFVATGTTMEIHPSSSGNNILVSAQNAASLSFNSKDIATYIGQTITLAGVTYQFTQEKGPTDPAYQAVSLTSLLDENGSDSIPALVMKLLKNKVDQYYETAAPDKSMFFSVSSNTMVATQDYITVGDDVQSYASSLTFENTNIDGYNNETVEIGGKTYTFTTTANPADTTQIDLTAVSSPVELAEALYNAVIANGGAVRYASGTSTILAESKATGYIENVTFATRIEQEITAIDFEKSTGIGTATNIVGKQFGQQSMEPDTSGTLVLNTAFDYNGVGLSQTGAVIPAVQFNADGTPKYINVEKTAIEWANGAEDMVDGIEGRMIQLNFGDENTSTGLTHLSGSFSTHYVNQDGAKFGSYSGVTIGQDGIVTAVFDNGVTCPIAMIPLATFTDSNSLTSLSGNVWIETTASGQPTLRSAGESGAGTIESNSLEKSTVDIAEEFTNMIVVQRAYSAATRIITTSDSMLEELLAIKR